MTCYDKNWFKLILISILLTYVTIQPSHGSAQEEKGGWLKERIRARLKKRLDEKPAPQFSTDIRSTIEKSGNYTFSIQFGGLTRYYIVHVPSRYSAKTPSPLIFALHGGGGDMTIQASDEYYNQISKSEKEGFVIVFPNGFSNFKSGQLATWNAGKCCGDARDKKIDDVGFIKEILKNLTHQLNIDSQKVFATGMSNGGLMSYRLACELSSTFKAIASVAGTDNTVNCKPSTPISILHIHTKDDDHVLFNGGAGQTFRDMSKVTEFTSVPSTIAKWVALNGCSPTPKRILEKPQVYCDQYLKCRNNVVIQLCVTESGGHSWPGGKKPRGGGAPSTAISANDVMWDFFKNR